MFRPIYLLLLFLLSVHLSGAQILKPVKWSFKSEVQGTAATLLLTANIEDGWHIYSQQVDENAGPLPTTFSFKPSSAYSLTGKTEEGKSVKKFDPNFGVDVMYLSGTTTFRQKVKLNTSGKIIIDGVLSFMVCNDEMCLPPDEVDFEFVINENANGKSETGKTQPLISADTTIAFQNESVPSIDTSANAGATLEEGCGDVISAERKSGSSLWGILIAGMLGGLLALFTPCVFPMVPMTVSFFTKRSGNRRKGVMNALVYALSIIVIYVVLGLLVTVIFGSDALNDLASNGIFNLLFFVIFIVFAISFFGVFEITIPSALINKADKASDRGGLIGIFFMAFTLSLVSFSCTGPIIGTLLVEAAHGRSYLGPALGMFGFAFALAVPFALFAMFPGWLQSLPKSGGWLNTVKVSLGFLELALALKFLSNVDLAYHWNILHRELFIVLWIIIFTLLGFYLLGKIRFSHDSEVSHIGVGRLMFALFSFAFALYLTPGIWGAPLKLISGFPPPDFYKEWKTGLETDCPQGINCFKDYDEGMRYARNNNKPVMLDFTGWSCVNCRKMEDNVWSDSKVLKRLKNDYVVISLYVDDKKELPQHEQKVSDLTGKKIRTVGNKWSELQARLYNTNSQPYYVLIDNKGQLLAEPRGYTPDIKQYLGFLDEGICRYQKRGSGTALVAEFK